MKQKLTRNQEFVFNYLYINFFAGFALGIILSGLIGSLLGMIMTPIFWCIQLAMIKTWADLAGIGVS